MQCPCCKSGEVDQTKLIAFGNVVMYGGKKFKANEQEIAGLLMAIDGYEEPFDNANAANVSKARKFLSQCRIPFKILRTSSRNGTGKYILIDENVQP